jgi:hypothetical protein
MKEESQNEKSKETDSLVLEVTATVQQSTVGRLRTLSKR